MRCNFKYLFYQKANIQKYRIFLYISIIFIIVSGIATAADHNVIVGFKKPVGQDENNTILSHGGTPKNNFHAIYAVSARVPDNKIAEIKSDPRVAYVEDEQTYKASDEYTNSWGVQHIGSQSVHNQSINGTGVKVAILDTGIDYNHVDLKDNYKGGYNFVSNNTNPMDDSTALLINSHGTRMAGIIGAEKNGIGVVGVAPNASLYAVKVLDGSTFGNTSWLISGIQWAIDNKMNIVSMSFEGPFSQALQNVCDAAYNSGILLVATAGNTYGGNVTYPAGYNSVIAVTATDFADQKANFSPIDPKIELSAPGVNINSTIIGGGYGIDSGTSMAAPFVTGAAALIYSTNFPDVDGDGVRDNKDVRIILQNSAKDLGSPGKDDTYGYGLVDAQAAVLGLTVVKPVLTKITVSSSIATLNVNGTQLFNATALDQNNTPMAGINISWTVSNSTVGNVSTLNAVTGTAGNVTTTFTAEAVGNATVNATNGSTTGSSNVIVVTMQLGNISGFKFNDINGNGIRDPVEPGLPNWTIVLTMPDRSNTTTTTNADGFYMFSNLLAGNYTIGEALQPDWVQTFPSVPIRNITLSAGENVSNIDFGNTQVQQAMFNISGFKINGTNNNGMGIENWNIMLINPTTGGEIANTITDSMGSYKFMNLSNGTYNITEGMKTGWTNVSSTSQMATINGTDVINVNFTNALITPTPATFNISGFKIDDTNGNGVWDSGEMGIENWNINLLNATTDTKIANTSTDASGFYQFMSFAPGSYNVTEEMKPGFIPTNATSRMITVENIDVMNVNFTNKPVAPSTAVTSFVLTPELTTTLKGMPITITITALNGNMSQTLFNGMADINITANNVSAVSSPMNVSFTNGNATILVTSSAAQFATVTAANNSTNGITQVMFADKIFSLSKGWNLISIPNFADSSSVSQALQNVQNNGVVGFDPATDNFSTPTDLEPLFGYWINVTADNQSIGFIASTTIPSMPPTRKLSEGWNLIGVSASRSDPDTLSAGELFVDLKRGLDYTQWLYTRLVSFEQPAAPVTFVAGTDLSDLTALKQGHGYWLFIKDLSSTNTNNLPWAGKQW